MKSIWNYIVAVGESLYRARIATGFARNGQYEKARKVMTQ